MNAAVDSTLNQCIAQMLDHQPGSVAFVAGLDEVMQMLDDQDPEQLLALAMVYRMFPKLPGAATHCSEYLKAAARLGHPVAVERLADLFAIGWGVEQNQQKVLDLYRQLAGYLIPQIVRELAWLNLTATGKGSDSDIGVEQIIEAALLGDEVAIAWLSSLEKYCDSESDPQGTLKQTFSMLVNACSLDELSQSDQATELREQLASLRDPANHQRIETLRQIISSLRLDGTGIATIIDHSPTASIQQLSSSPRQYRIQSSLNELQLDYLDHLRPNYTQSDHSDDEPMLLSLHDQGPVMRSIQARLSIHCQLPVEHMERAMFSHVGTTTSSNLATALTQTQIREQALALDDSGQRLVLAVLAIEPVDVVGSDETDMANLKRGDLLIHHLTRPDGLPDPMAGPRLRAPSGAEQSQILQIGFRQHSTLAPVMETL